MTERREDAFGLLGDVAQYEQRAFENHRRQYLRENPPRASRQSGAACRG
jgi:hypothetical protein